MDAARSASATLDWLNSHGYSRLARDAHVVLSSSRPSSSEHVKVDKIVAHFAARCHSIHVVPFDQHLSEGAPIHFDELKSPTRKAYLELAGAISERFGMVRREPDLRHRRTET